MKRYKTRCNICYCASNALFDPVTFDDLIQVSLERILMAAGVDRVTSPILHQCVLHGLALRDFLEQPFQSFLAGQAFGSPVRFEQFCSFVVQCHVQHMLMVQASFGLGKFNP